MSSYQPMGAFEGMDDEPERAEYRRARKSNCSTEYQTHHVVFDCSWLDVSAELDAEMVGWRRVWADVRTTDAFVVYCRPVK